jgi:hypothetical protein
LTLTGGVTATGIAREAADPLLPWCKSSALFTLTAAVGPAVAACEGVAACKAVAACEDVAAREVVAACEGVAACEAVAACEDFAACEEGVCSLAPAALPLFWLRPIAEIRRSACEEICNAMSTIVDCSIRTGIPTLAFANVVSVPCGLSIRDGCLFSCPIIGITGLGKQTSKLRRRTIRAIQPTYRKEGLQLD